MKTSPIIYAFLIFFMLVIIVGCITNVKWRIRAEIILSAIGTALCAIGIAVGHSENKKRKAEREAQEQRKKDVIRMLEEQRNERQNGTEK